jgi:hypothetical protein
VPPKGAIPEGGFVFGEFPDEAAFDQPFIDPLELVVSFMNGVR